MASSKGKLLSNYRCILSAGKKIFPFRLQTLVVQRRETGVEKVEAKHFMSLQSIFVLNAVVTQQVLPAVPHMGQPHASSLFGLWEHSQVTVC